MATHYGAYTYGVTTYGTVLNLDASNTLSYPGTGTTWIDLSGKGNNATLINSPTYSSNSIVFDGVNDTATLAYNSNLSFTNNFTLDATVAVTAYQSTTYYGLTNMIIENGSASTYNYALQISNDTTIAFIKRTGTEGLMYYTFTVPSLLNRRVNIVMTYLNNALSLYLNGILISSQTVTNIAPDVTPPFSIGGKLSPPATAFTGRIYNIRIYNRALPAYEILKNAKVLGV